jgi:hypothetical protein
MAANSELTQYRGLETPPSKQKWKEYNDKYSRLYHAPCRKSCPSIVKHTHASTECDGSDACAAGKELVVEEQASRWDVCHHINP